MIAPTVRPPHPRHASVDARRALWIALCGVFLPAMASAANSVYPEPIELQALGGPTVVVSLDVNEDGLPDLVVNGPRLNRISVLLGSGSGGFSSDFRFDTSPREAADMVTVDVDRDGLGDVVWVDGLRGDVVTYFQVPGLTGDVFRPVVLPGDETATAIEAVDRDGDGWVDVVVALRGADQLVWYRNVEGTLVEEERIDTGDGPRDVRTVRDATGQTQLTVLRDGYLSRDVAAYALGAVREFDRWSFDDPLGMVIGDLEDDGIQEILVTDAQGQVVVLDPQVDALVPRTTFAVRPNSPWALPVSVSADATRVLVAETGRGRLSLFEDAGAGFVPMANWFLSRNVARPLYADVDRDGFRELALPLPDEDLVLVVDPLVDGYLVPDAIETGARPRRVVSTPLGDENPRVAILTETAKEIWIYETVDSQLRALQVIQAPPAADELVFYDFDGQNGADLLMLDGQTGVHRAYAQADGRLGAFESLYPTSTARDMAVGECLATPGPEIVLADAGILGLRYLAETSPGVWTVELEQDVGQTPILVRLKDLDDNGFEDAAVLSLNDRFTLVFTDAEGLLSTTAFNTPLSPRDLAFGNFNGDPFPDIVVASAGTATFTLYSSFFRGFYSPSDTNNDAPFGAQNVAVADLNRDGVDDVLLGSPGSASISIHTVLAPQGILLESTQQIRVCEEPGEFITAFLDGDDIADIVAVDRVSDVLVTVRSDPFSLVPVVTGALAPVWSDEQVDLTVTSDARVVDEFAVFRAADGAPVPMRFDAPGRWVGVDEEPIGADPVYVLRDRLGVELDRQPAVDAGSATSVGTAPGESQVEVPVVRGRAVTLRFRTGGNQAPTVRVHDLRGRLVGRATVRTAGEGWFESTWNGRDLRGRRAARGRYFVRIDGPDGTLSAPVTLR